LSLGFPPLSFLGITAKANNIWDYREVIVIIQTRVSALVKFSFCFTMKVGAI
jgi:hypothetical protein